MVGDSQSEKTVSITTDQKILNTENVEEFVHLLANMRPSDAIGEASLTRTPLDVDVVKSSQVSLIVNVESHASGVPNILHSGIYCVFFVIAYARNQFILNI